MPTPVSHTALYQGRSSGLILACDFTATGRTVAGFADLARAVRPAESVWETAPPPTAAASPSGVDCVEFWLEDLHRSTAPVNTVLGFCVGSVFAAELATRVAEVRGQAPKVIVFDPERPDADLLHRHYREAVESLAGTLSRDELTAAQDAGQAAHRDLTELADLGAELPRLLGEHCGPAFARIGLDTRRIAELTAVFSRFLAYLVAAAQLDPRRVWARSTALSSATAHSGLNPLPAAERAAAVAAELRFDVPHTDLLRNPRVGEAVRTLIA